MFPAFQRFRLPVGEAFAEPTVLQPRDTEQERQHQLAGRRRRIHAQVDRGEGAAGLLDDALDQRQRIHHAEARESIEFANDDPICLARRDRSDRALQPRPLRLAPALIAVFLPGHDGDLATGSPALDVSPLILLAEATLLAALGGRDADIGDR